MFFCKKPCLFLALVLVFTVVTAFTLNKIEIGKVSKNKSANYIVCTPDKLKIFISDDGMSVNSFVKENRDILAAINATFFDKRDSGLIPTGLVYSEGEELWKSAIDVSNGNCPVRKSSYLKKKAKRESKWFYIIYVTKDSNGNYSSGIEYSADFQKKFLETDKKDDIVTAIETGPMVLKNKKITYKAFADRPSRDRKVRRSAVGILKNGNILVYQSRKGQTFEDLAKSMRNLGAIDAVGLDGGSSCSFATPKTRTKEVKVNTIIYVVP